MDQKRSQTPSNLLALLASRYAEAVPVCTYCACSCALWSRTLQFVGVVLHFVCVECKQAPGSFFLILAIVRLVLNEGCWFLHHAHMYLEDTFKLVNTLYSLLLRWQAGGLNMLIIKMLQQHGIHSLVSTRVACQLHSTCLQGALCSCKTFVM